MAGIQGRRFTEEQIARVRHLLAETEMTTHEIAHRMGFSPSTIISINRRSDIRRYNGKRSQWEKGSSLIAQASMTQP